MAVTIPEATPQVPVVAPAVPSLVVEGRPGLRRRFWPRLAKIVEPPKDRRNDPIGSEITRLLNEGFFHPLLSHPLPSSLSLLPSHPSSFLAISLSPSLVPSLPLPFLPPPSPLLSLSFPAFLSPSLPPPPPSLLPSLSPSLPSPPSPLPTFAFSRPPPSSFPRTSFSRNMNSVTTAPAASSPGFFQQKQRLQYQVGDENASDGPLVFPREGARSEQASKRASERGRGQGSKGERAREAGSAGLSMGAGAAQEWAGAIGRRFAAARSNITIVRPPE